MNIDHWPTLDAEAYYGPLGGFVYEAAPHTEADPAAILISGLVELGSLIGPGPHTFAGDARHGVNLGAVVVGETAKARKGTAGQVAAQMLEVLDQDFAEKVKGGFGSGEKLVDDVNDVDDHRLLVVETEFSRVLRVCSRDGSVLSQMIRDSWDGRPLQARSRGKTSVALQHHVSMLGHITLEELQRSLSDTDIYGGFANRFLWCLARRQRVLSNGGNVPTSIIATWARPLSDAVQAARQVAFLGRSPAADSLWAELYEEMSKDDPGGLLGAAISRDAPQLLRLSLMYALLDSSRVVESPHLISAAAVWRYCRASAEAIFGDLSGDTVTDRVLAALRRVAPGGLTRDGLHDALSRHATAIQLAMSLQFLEERGLVVTRDEGTGGRPRSVSYAVCE